MSILLEKARAGRRQAIAGRASRAAMNREHRHAGMRLRAPRETDMVAFVSTRALPRPGAFLQ